MLRFLIMHVRGLARADAAMDATSHHPADSADAPPSEQGSVEAPAAMGAGESLRPPRGTLASDPSVTVRSSIVPAAGHTVLMLLVSALGYLCGCACLSRDACDSRVVAARQLSLKGIDAQQSGQWDEAESLLTAAMRENPADERVHQYYAQVMWQRGKSAEAIAHMEESARLSGGDPQLVVQLGEMYLQQRNLNAAWDCAEEAVAANRRLPSAWALRGDVLRQQHKWDAALESYHRALSEQPHYLHVQLAAADVYREQNRPRRALATLDAVAGQLRPQEIPLELRYQQGLAYKALGRYSDAVSALTLASQYSDVTADMLFHLGESQLLAGNSASATLAVQAALERSPTHAPSLRLKDQLARQNQTLTASLQP